MLQSIVKDRYEMRMVRWMCNVKVQDRAPSKELREKLGIDDIILILQQNRLRWYGHVLRKVDTVVVDVVVVPSGRSPAYSGPIC